MPTATATECPQIVHPSLEVPCGLPVTGKVFIDGIDVMTVETYPRCDAHLWTVVLALLSRADRPSFSVERGR